jgi:plasmid maintenance system killer protein
MKKMEYENKLLDKFLQPVKDAHLEQSFTESLKNRLKYGYQYSLRKRLDQLLDSPNGEEFLTLFVAKDGENEKQKIATETSTASEKDQKLMQWMKNYREAFVEKTVKTRNWYTHFDEDDRSQAVTDGLELEFLNRKLRLFLAALLLGQLHAPPEEVKSKFHHHKFSYLRNAQ